MKARLLRWSTVLCSLGILCAPLSASAQVVIAEFQTGGSSAAQEYIALYNNSAEEVDITGWCLQYASASNATTTNLYCLNVAHQEFAIAPYSSLYFATNEFVAVQNGFVADYIFSSGLAASGGHIKLVNGQTPKVEVDKVGWGTASSPEGSAAPAPPSGSIMQRLTDGLIRQDTNNNLADFGIDLCLNIDGVQTQIPGGMAVDISGDCLLDTCLNIDGVQQEIPENVTVDDNGICTEQLEDAVIVITEVLPNVAGSDTGKEYIELYNPNERAVNLQGYTLAVGPDDTQSYTLLDQILLPLTYMAFSDMITGITLPNSSAFVSLRAPAGTVVSQTATYDAPKDDAAWALIDDAWQYTMQPTPSAANVLLITSASVGGATELEPCPEGKFRNPETNRCKNIEGDTELAACSAGQERNPETNRCRNVSGSTDGLTPCREGQERNPDTNRCRNIASQASSLVPCEPGEQRNPETNRCRKIAGSVQAAATSNVQDVPSPVTNTQTWVAIGALAAAALGYAVYEWRYELGRLVSRLRLPNIKRG